MGEYNIFFLFLKKKKDQYMGTETQFKHPIIIVAKLRELTLCKAFCSPYPI